MKLIEDFSKMLAGLRPAWKSTEWESKQNEWVDWMKLLRRGEAPKE